MTRAASTRSACSTRPPACPSRWRRRPRRPRGLDGLPDRDDIENVVVLGMGGSGIAGDILLGGRRRRSCPCRSWCARATSCPHFVGESTLVFAISFSGNTEETVEAATEAAVAGRPGRRRHRAAASSAELAVELGRAA